MSKKVKVKLSGKVKYNGNRHRAGSEIEISEKDVEFFKENELASEVIGEVEKEESPKGPADSKEPEEKPLEEKTVAELMDVAQEIDLEGRSSLRNDKDELLAAVKKALAEKDGE